MKTSTMNLVITLLIAFLCQAQCHQINKRSLFSWRSEPQDPDPAPSGYLPILKVHKYNGIQINPIQGPPVYLPSGPIGDSNSFEGQTVQLSPEQIDQLSLINRLASFLPEDDKLQEMDLSAVLPYADLISEDSLDKIRFAVESTKTKEKSKLLKFLAFIKYIKEKKLKPFKLAASIGSKIVHKKKEKVAWLFGGTPSTTTPLPEPITETSPPSYPYNFAYTYNPYLTQNKQFFNSYSTAAPEPSQSPFAGYPYPPQFPSNFQFIAQPKIPSNTESNAIPTQPAAPQYQESLPSPPAASKYPKYPTNFQFPEQPQQIVSNQYQFNIPQSADLPTFPNNQYQPQYQSAPASSEQPKNEVAYEYKQSPASTFATQDNAAIRQFAGITNNSDLPQYDATPAPQQQFKIQPAPQQYYSFPQNFILPFNAQQQPIFVPNFQQQGNYKKSDQEANKFYLTPAHTSLPNDLTPSGSENILKIENRVKPESKPDEIESQKVTSDLHTSTEITFTKSKQSTGKRTVLRAVTPKAPVYETSSKDESLKGDENKSTPVTSATVN